MNEHSSEFEKYRNYIQSDSAKQAYDYLLFQAHSLEGFEIQPKPHGEVTRSIGFLKDGEQPYAFIVAQNWLLFYLRVPSNSTTEQIEDLRREFDTIKENKSGEVNFRIHNLTEAKRAVSLIFGKAQDRTEELFPDEVNKAECHTEGAVSQILVNRYERDAKARTKCLKAYGYQCTVCGFDFESTYGEIGREFIHVHHLKEISSIRKEYEIKPKDDLRPVCPNCHCMLHQRKPAYTIEELKEKLSA